MHQPPAYNPAVSRAQVLQDIKLLYQHPAKGASFSNRWDQLGYNDKAIMVKEIIAFLDSAPNNMSERFLAAMEAVADSLYRNGRQKHAEALLIALLDTSKDSSALVHGKAHLALANHYQYRLMDDKAIDHYENGRDILSLSNADTRLDLVAPLECLAMLYEKNADFAEMARCYEEIRDICEAAQNTTDPRVVHGLADLLKCDFIRSKPEEVEKIALNALKRMQEPKYIGIKSETLMVLGDHYSSLKREKLANTLYQQAIDLLSSPEFKLVRQYPKLLHRLRQRIDPNVANQ